MAMGMMTEYYHFIFTTLVMYLWVLAQERGGTLLDQGHCGLAWASPLKTIAAARGDPSWTCFLRL